MTSVDSDSKTANWPGLAIRWSSSMRKNAPINGAGGLGIHLVRNLVDGENAMQLNACLTAQRRQQDRNPLRPTRPDFRVSRRNHLLLLVCLETRTRAA